MHLLWFLLIGLIAGWLAGKVFHGHGYGVVGNIIVGVLGALVGGYLFRVVGLSFYGTLGSLLTAFVGALVLLAIIYWIARK